MKRFTLDPNSPPELSALEAARLDAGTDPQVTADAASDVENPLLTKGELAKLATARLARDARQATHLTQNAFARTYHFTPGRLRDLEQGRTRMDSVTRAYLTLIRLDPAFVRRTLEQTK